VGERDEDLYINSIYIHIYICIVSLLLHTCSAHIQIRVVGCVHNIYIR